MASSYSSSSSSSVSDTHEYGEERCAMGLLSDDTLLAMLRVISTRELLSSAALVCRRWRRLCEQSLVHELVPSAYNPSERPWGSVSAFKLLKIAAANSSTIGRICLHGLKRLRADDTVTLIQSLPKLKELSIVSCVQIASTTDMVTIASQLPSQLISLDLHADHFAMPRCHDCARILPPIPPLIQDGVLDALSQRCSKLQKLDLDSCSTITARGLDGLLQACHSLTSLDLHSHVLGWREVLKVFNSCKSLCHFSLVSPMLVQSLGLGDDDTLEGNMGDTLGELISADALVGGGSYGSLYRPRRNLPSRLGRDGHGNRVPEIVLPKDLTSLRLYNSPHRSIPMELAPMLGLLERSGKQLRQLHAQGVYNTSWHRITTWCPDLKLLDLSHCKHDSLNLTEVEGLVLCGLVQNLKKLEYIALPAATDAILRQIGQHCPRLREIRFQGYGASNSPTYFQGVTDEGVVAVAEGCPELRVLSLAGCRKVTIRSARAIAFHCRHLKVLILNRCRDFKDDAVTALLAFLSSSLVYLDLAGCRITQNTLETILQYAPETTLRVVAIPSQLGHSPTVIPVCNHIKECNPKLQVRVGKSCISWDGFYHQVSL